jgi:predicted ester cyclase
VYYDSQGNPNDLAATMGRIAPILTAIPDRSIHVEDQIVTENRVVLRWRRTGTFQSDAWGLHATGNHISDVGATILGIDSNGMISEAWEFWDVFNFFNQMGVIRAYVDIAAPQQPPAAGSASR